MSIEESVKALVQEEVTKAVKKSINDALQTLCGVVVGAAGSLTMESDEIIEHVENIIGGVKSKTAKKKYRKPAVKSVKVKTATQDSRDAHAGFCAIVDCEEPRRSKGYCGKHYQKLRHLIKTNRRPPSWKDDAAPNSVQDVSLPRGRAAAKALASAAAEIKARDPHPMASLTKKKEKKATKVKPLWDVKPRKSKATNGVQEKLKLQEHINAKAAAAMAAADDLPF